MWKKAWAWIDDRTGIVAAVGPLIKHKVPRKAKWAYVFGSAILVAFLVLILTGIALSTSYVTSTADAYQSLIFISSEPLGRLIRGAHYFAASAMVLLVGIHAVQTFLYAAYKFPREVNWLTGVVLLFLTIGMGFTGQLLRWDQNAVWSVVVGAEQAGRTPFIGEWVAKFVLAGDNISGATLSRFFSLHVFAIPALIFAFVGAHLYLVIRNGVSEPPEKGRVVDPKTYRQEYEEILEKDGVPFYPDSFWRDAVAAILVVGFIFALAAFVGAPQLDNPPDPSILKAAPKPDWYLLWYFALLAVIPPVFNPYLIIGGPLLFAIIMFALPFFANKGERSYWRRPWAVGITVIIVLLIVPLWIAGNEEPWSPKVETQPLPQAVIGQNVSAQVNDGAALFNSRGCLYCHRIGDYGGQRGPNLTNVGQRLTQDQLITRINVGGNGMPAYASILPAKELNNLVAFLQSRRELPNDTAGQPPTGPGEKK